MRETGVAADLVGPVVQHADPRMVIGGLSAGSLGVSPFGYHHRLVESLTGEQHGVAQKSMQLREIGRSAFGEVRVCLRGKPDRNGGTFHQLGTRRAFAAEHDQRQTGRPQRGEFAGDLRRRPEDPQHHYFRFAENVLDGLTRRVAQAVRRQ